MSSITISATAYYKLILHSCRYFASQVGGILLASTSSSDSLRIVDAVPLFHGNPPATTFDLGFTLIESYAKKQNLKIVGYYHGSELKQTTDAKLGTLAQRVGDRIFESSGTSVVLLIDNNTPLNGEAASIKVFTNVNKRWSPASIADWEIEGGNVTLHKVLEYVAERRYLNLNDLDNHLDNPKNEWLTTTNSLF
eukprot:TRINITY_DN5654_c0_g3_i1.p1 TRINITY_DN5654_c0_g3~~TRINITY_DN5654_c0_g3_i1.p1  ORF type:complete len:224 (+),score=45.00 TRINITY_DN5654_c0_g3_i1:92-673(+)